MLWPEPITGTVANWGITLLITLASYLLGCMTAGYYLVRWRMGIDIRSGGSGSAGATNVSRELGTAGFIVTFFVDLAKGAFAAWLAVYFDLGGWARLLCVLAVVSGHIWPVQLRFRGGKGVAAMLGVLLVADYRMVLIMAVLCLTALAFLRRFTPAGIVAMAAAPPAAVFVFPPTQRALSLLLLLLPVLYAHRDNIRDDVGSLVTGLARKSSAGLPSRKE